MPTTTIGPFPQTDEIRAARRAGTLSEADYRAALQVEICQVVERREALGLDVLVHGEAERNDHGRVFRRAARWLRLHRIRRGAELRFALALRDEVCDLEAAGVRIAQVDEPTIREGLPSKRAEKHVDWPGYLDWAVHAFRTTASGVRAETRIHTLMCCSEFNAILPPIAAMDADVVTTETSRGRMKLLDGFGDLRYPDDIGPGVYDIHSPQVPARDEMRTAAAR